MTVSTLPQGTAARELATIGRDLYLRGLAHGASGNLSLRIDADRWLITPTNSCLGRLDADNLALIDGTGAHLAGAAPSKEARLHLAWYAARPECRAVVHLHSPCVTALVCRPLAAAAVLPPITPYLIMRIGSVGTVPFLPPGSDELAQAVGAAASRYGAVLMANHGFTVGGRDLADAAFNAEEIEETARLVLLNGDAPLRLLTNAEIDGLRRGSDSRNGGA